MGIYQKLYPRIAEQIVKLGAENILCVFTTTSTFAPRTPDDVPAVAKVGLWRCGVL